MWTVYRVRWDFITQVCASVPGKSSMIEGWLNARAPEVRPPSARPMADIHAEVLATQLAPEEQPEEPTTLVFQRVPDPRNPERRIIAMRWATIKAHLKDCAYQLQTYTAGYIPNEKTLRVKVANGIYYWPKDPNLVMFHGTPFVPILGPDGKPMNEPNGIKTTAMGDEQGQGPREKAIHVVTPMGQRSALKAFEFCEEASMEFWLAVLTAPDREVRRTKDVIGPDGKVKKVPEIVKVPGKPIVDTDDLKGLMLYGGMHGYAGERSEDGGRYGHQITEENV